MKKVAVKSCIVLVLVLAAPALSWLSTSLIYDLLVVDKCFDDGGQYISDLAMCYYGSGGAEKVNFHAYTWLYIWSGTTVFFVALLAFVYKVLKKKYNNALKLRTR